MKLVFVLALFHGNLAAQSLLDKSVNLNVKNQPLSHALKQLAKSNDLQLAYSEQFFNKKTKVTVQVKKKPARLVLDELLADTGVGYKEAGGQIVLYQLPIETVKWMTLSGFVEDAETGERLIAAAVYCPEIGQGTVTNEYGFYSLTLPSTARNLRFDYIGYSDETVSFIGKNSQRIDQALRPSLILSEVVVTPTDTAIGNLLPSPASMKRFKPDDFKATPDLGGQSDLFRMMQMLPGVQSSTDGTGGMYIRGGNADQNLVLMDGVPVYNVDHMLGMYSIFNTSTIRDAKLLKGSIPARYGGRISSVVDVYTKEGNQNRLGGEFGIDLVSAKATLEGPFAKKKGTFMVSGRRTFRDFYLLPFLNKLLFTEDFINPKFRFFDFNSKLTYQFSDKDKLYLSFYNGRDRYEGKEEYEYDMGFDKSEFELKWGNTITSLRWNHLFNQKLFSNTSLTYSRFNFSLGSLTQSTYYPPEPNVPPTAISYFLGLSSQNRDWAWKTDFNYNPLPNHYLRFGAGVTQHEFKPNAQVYQYYAEDGSPLDSLNLDDYIALNTGKKASATSVDAYVEDEWRVAEKLTFNTGIRLAGFVSEGKAMLLPEPRINAAYQLNSRQKITASLCRTTQYLHRVATLGFLFPGDYWTPSNQRLGPQKAWQATLGTEGDLGKGFEFSAELYYKTMHGLLAFPDSFFYEPFVGEDPSGYFVSMDGKSRGLELLLRRDEGRLGGWLGYGLSKTTRESNYHNSGKPYPFNFDRRHEVKAYVYLRMGKHWLASTNWIYGSPNPQLSDEGNISSPSGQLNGLRSTPYHRLDLALSFTAKTGRLEHQLKFSIFNAYNRKNVAFYTLEYDEVGNIKGTRPIYLFPAMLGLYYGVKF